MYYQQGDVIIELVDSIPEKAVKADNVLAEGEATGHKHIIEGKDIGVFEKDGILYVSAPNGGTLVHEEHKQIEVQPGTYRMRKVREYDHFSEEARKVRD